MFVLKLYEELYQRCYIKKRRNIRNEATSQYPIEIISFNDPAYYPPETGPIQKSFLSEKLRVPKCRIDQYVWENMASWKDKTAVVS